MGNSEVEVVDEWLDRNFSSKLKDEVRQSTEMLSRA